MRSRRWGLWAWGVTAPVILVAVLVMGAAPGACDAKFLSNTASAPSANCFEFWLNRYQTMVSGLLALSAAVVAYLAAKAQISHAEGLEEKRRQAQEAAARARLALALDEVCDYATACMIHFKKHLQNAKDSSPIQLPHFPQRAVKPLQNCIRFADVVHARKIAELLLFLQAFKARINVGELWKTTVLYDRIKDGAVLDVLAGELFAYARGMDEVWMKNPHPKKIGRSIVFAGFSVEEHQDLFLHAGLAYFLPELALIDPIGDEDDREDPDQP